MKTVQWNIGGAKIRSVDSGLYDTDGLQEIVAFLEHEDPDIITLQETHADRRLTQAAFIAKALGLGFWHNDVYADSHVERGQKLGQAIITKYPITQQTFMLFENPDFQGVWDGKTVLSHDKGVSTFLLDLGADKAMQVQLLHMVPFRPFGIDPLSAEGMKVLDNVADTILQSQETTRLLQGDFNINSSSLRDHFPALFDDGFTEIEQTERTTPKGRCYDHVLYANMTLLGSRVDETVGTDHYPIISVWD